MYAEGISLVCFSYCGLLSLVWFSLGKGRISDDWFVTWCCWNEVVIYNINGFKVIKMKEIDEDARV